MPRTFIDDAICPACRGIGLEYTAEEIDLPYLGTSLETMMRCDRCGYRHSDFMLTGQKEPMRYALTVATEDDMTVRVVRSSSGTLRIPELGILIEPGMASEAFISNVEGVIVRVERVLGQLRRDAQEHQDQEQLGKIMDLEDVLARLRRGEADPVTLIVDDPLGNSAILGEHALKQVIPPEVVKDLKVGAFVIDPSLEEEEGKEGASEDG